MHKTSKIILWGLIGVVGIAVLSFLIFNMRSRGAKEAATPDYWPTRSWKTSTPEEQGIDSVKLAEGLQAIKDNNIAIHSLLLIRNGRIVVDAYFYPYDGRSYHNVESVTKSFTTTLVAIAADQNKLNLDQPALSFFPEYTIANRDARKESMTVKDLAKMANGMESMGVENDEGTLEEMKASSDWIQFALNRKMVAKPGIHFVYDSPGMHILSAIIQQSTGNTEFEFARKNLFEPLGIQEVFWETDPQGYNHGWGDLYLYPRDAAKLGYLWLSQGVWDGKQIVSKEWVKDAVTSHIKTGDADNYGYGWWVPINQDPKNYFALGRGGQYVLVLPDWNAILVLTGTSFELDDIKPFLMPAIAGIGNPLPANPDGVAHLNEIVASLLQASAPEAVNPLPEIAKTISSKIIVFDPNPFNVKTLQLVFNDSAEANMELDFSDNQPPRKGTIGLDGVYRFSPGRNQLPAALRGVWQDDQTFIFEYDEVANRNAYSFVMHFDGDQVTLEVKERAHANGVKMKGMLQNP
jgi:CubicO group peptidase (beta-lactamase class C family)